MVLKKKQPFRWAFLGAGPVSRKFLLGLRALGNHTQVTVVASRHRNNAERFAKEFGVTHVASDYADAATKQEVDALYIATPPSEHEKHAMLGIAAGKPVLIEKPFAMNAAAAQRIASAAREANVFCMEAMWTRFLPLIAKIKGRIETGEIGELRGFHGSFFGSERPDRMASLFDPDRGGGALMHRGIYPLSIARHLLGPISEIQAMAHIGKTGVDEDCALTLRHASGAITTLRASLRTGGENIAAIYGTKGTIWIRSPIYRPFLAEFVPSRPRAHDQRARRLEALLESTIAQNLFQRSGAFLKLVRNRGIVLRSYFSGNGYHYEAKALMDAVANGQIESPIMPLSESIEIMSAIDCARVQWTKGMS